MAVELKMADHSKLTVLRNGLADAWLRLQEFENELTDVEGLDDLLDDEWETVSMMVADLDDVIEAVNSVLGKVPDRFRLHRVIQVMETREEVAVFVGTEDQCHDWMDENAEQFVESTFYVEGVE